MTPSVSVFTGFDRITNLRRFSHVTVFLVPGVRNLYIFYKFNLLDTNTPLLRALSMTPSVSVFTGFDRITNLRRFSHVTVFLVPGVRNLYIFYKFNLLDTNTPLLRALSMTPSVSVFTGFDRITNLRRFSHVTVFLVSGEWKPWHFS